MNMQRSSLGPKLDSEKETYLRATYTKRVCPISTCKGASKSATHKLSILPGQLPYVSCTSGVACNLLPMFDGAESFMAACHCLILVPPAPVFPAPPAVTSYLLFAREMARYAAVSPILSLTNLLLAFNVCLRTRFSS